MPFALGVYEAGIVACCYKVGTKYSGVFREHLKFDLLITQDIRVWRSARFVFVEEVRKDVIPIFCCKICFVKFYTEFLTDLSSIR